MEDPILILRAISEPNRIRTLFLLAHFDLNVTELAGKLELKQNLVSHHLKVLTKAGIISPTRVGNHLFYQVRAEWKERLHYLFQFLKIT